MQLFPEVKNDKNDITNKSYKKKERVGMVEETQSKNAKENISVKKEINSELSNAAQNVIYSG